jgi:hypothetical protein
VQVDFFGVTYTHVVDGHTVGVQVAVPASRLEVSFFVEFD